MFDNSSNIILYMAKMISPMLLGLAFLVALILFGLSVPIFLPLVLLFFVISFIPSIFSASQLFLVQNEPYYCTFKPYLNQKNNLQRFWNAVLFTGESFSKCCSFIIAAVLSLLILPMLFSGRSAFFLAASKIYNFFDSIIQYLTFIPSLAFCTSAALVAILSVPVFWILHVFFGLLKCGWFVLTAGFNADFSNQFKKTFDLSWPNKFLCWCFGKELTKSIFEVSNIDTDISNNSYNQPSAQNQPQNLENNPWQNIDYMDPAEVRQAVKTGPFRDIVQYINQTQEENKTELPQGENNESKNELCCQIDKITVVNRNNESEFFVCQNGHPFLRQNLALHLAISRTNLCPFRCNVESGNATALKLATIQNVREIVQSSQPTTIQAMSGPNA